MRWCGVRVRRDDVGFGRDVRERGPAVRGVQREGTVGVRCEGGGQTGVSGRLGDERSDP